MKKSHTTKAEVDLLKPVDPLTVQPTEPSDCFGVEFEPRAPECAVCADGEICNIVWAENVKNKKKAFEAEHGPLMDTVDFKAVDMQRIERLAKKYQDDGEPMTLEELQEAIQTQAKTKDKEAVIQFIKGELPLTKIYIKEGVCLVR